MSEYARVVIVAFECCSSIGDLYPESEEKENKEEPDWVKTEKEQFHNFRDKNKDGKMDRVLEIHVVVH